MADNVGTVLTLYHRMLSTIISFQGFYLPGTDLSHRSETNQTRFLPSRTFFSLEWQTDDRQARSAQGAGCYEEGQTGCEGQSRAFL